MDVIMYKAGDLAVYASHGVCRVESVDTPQIASADKTKKYYTLKPLYKEYKIFVPVDTSIFMRPVISYEEAQNLISLIPLLSENINTGSNIKSTEDYYNEFLKTHDCFDLIKAIKNIYNKKSEALANKKKVSAVDERFMKKAEELLYGEFSVALKIPKEDVKGYIEQRVTALSCT